MNFEIIPPENLRLLSKKAAPSSQQLFRRWKKKPPGQLDKVIKDIHEEVFSQIDCLKCAQCCKSISPTLYYKDMERLASSLRFRPSDFMDKYIQVDEDQDFVFKQTPCPFLMNDNYCQAYDSRPKACREYPHTNRVKFHQILDLTLKNTSVCPAAYHIVEELKKRESDIR